MAANAVNPSAISATSTQHLQDLGNYIFIGSFGVLGVFQLLHPDLCVELVDSPALKGFLSVTSYPVVRLTGFFMLFSSICMFFNIFALGDSDGWGEWLSLQAQHACAWAGGRGQRRARGGAGSAVRRSRSSPTPTRTHPPHPDATIIGLLIVYCAIGDDFWTKPLSSDIHDE